MITEEQKQRIRRILQAHDDNCAEDFEGVSREDADLVIQWLESATEEEWEEMRFAAAVPCKGDERACRVCGCTQDHACAGGCFWVEWDLCSGCIDFQEVKK